MKKFIISIVALITLILGILGATGCGASKIPTYKGMTIANHSIIATSLTALKGEEAIDLCSKDFEDENHTDLEKISRI